MPVSGLPDVALVIGIFLVLLVPFAAVGLALINTGLGRSHSAAHLMLGSLCAFAVACGVYFVFGFAWQGYIGMPSHTHAGGRQALEFAGRPAFLLSPFPR